MKVPRSGTPISLSIWRSPLRLLKAKNLEALQGNAFKFFIFNVPSSTIP